MRAASQTLTTLLLLTLFCAVLGGDARAQAPGQAQPGDWLQTPAPTALPVDDAKDEGISGGRIAGEVLVGGLVGVGGALVGGLVGIAVEDCDGDDSFCGLAGGLIGGYAGYSTGVALGVYGVGSGGDYEGSLGATVGGSFLGGAGAIVMTVATDGDAALLLPLAPMAGALIGFHTTTKRRSSKKERPPVIGNLINVDDGNTSLGLPMLSVAPTGEVSGHATMLQLAGGTI